MIFRAKPITLTKKYYYSLGNEYAARTGGYDITYSYRGTTTLAKNAESMVITAYESNNAIGYCCNLIAIDVTNISTIYIDWEATIRSSKDGVNFGVAAANTNNSFLKSVGSTAASFLRTVTSLDVSSVSGNVYLKIHVANSTESSAGDCVVTVYQIYGEKAA